MKLFSMLAIILAVALPHARAQQDPDDQYVAIYAQMQQADSLESAGQPREALAAYAGAQSELQKFGKIYPDWNQTIVGYRLNYLAGKISGLTALLPPLTNAPAQTEPAVTNTASTDLAPGLEPQLDGLRAQVQGLQSDNATLEAKLKEALAVQPAAVDPGELAKAQEQVQSLMKENDLLKASVAQISATTVVTNVVETPAPDPELTNLQSQVASLQSQVEVGSLEKIALENRIQQLQSAAASAPVAPPAAVQAQALTNAPDTQSPPSQPEPQPAASSDTTKKSISELPEGSADLVAEAQHYFAAKQFDKAEDDYRKILQRDPNNPLALGNLAAIELEQGNLDDTETHIKAALAQSPDDAYNLSIFGYLKFRQEKYDEAFDALSRAAKLDPQNPEIENYLGVTLSHKGMRAQAETELRKAIEIDPNYAAAHNNLAVIYISEEPPSVELARLEYQKAIDAGQPRNPDLEKLLAEKGAPLNPQ